MSTSLTKPPSRDTESQGERRVTQNEDRRTRPPVERLTHFVFLTACFASFSLIPFFLMRSRNASLMREMSELKATQTAFQKEMIKRNRETRVALDKIQLLMIEERRRDKERASVEEGIRRDVKELLHERQHTKYVPFLPLYTTSPSTISQTSITHLH